MKLKFKYSFTVLVLFICQTSFAQLAEDSWSFGFGFSYPRFYSVDVRPAENNYGGYISLQRNFSEEAALRILGSYRHISAKVPEAPRYLLQTTPAALAPFTQEVYTNVIGGSLDLLYYFDPCSPVSPYMLFGAGVIHYDAVWDGIINPFAEAKTTAALNLGFGVEWRIGTNWNMKTELGLHSTDGQVDGVLNNNRQGIFGSNADQFLSVDIGFQYFFSKGEPSKYCDLYSGITVTQPGRSYPTLEEIEDAARRNAPKETEIDYDRIERIIQNYPAADKNWILTGVNFQFNKSSLLPEAYPILDHAVSVLKENPDLKVEIGGHTDNIGAEKFNQKLSLARAETVRDYLVSKGINKNRLTVIGFGESNPISDNSTETGRAKNRRVEFKVR